MEPKKTSAADLIKAIDNLGKWFRRLAGAGVLAFCAVLLVAIALYHYQVSQDEERARGLENSRITRLVEFCKQDNIETRRTREFSEDQLVAVFSIFSSDDVDPETIRESRAEEFEEYRAFVDSTFLYRDCSRECVVVYTTPEPNCPAPKDFPD